MTERNPFKWRHFQPEIITCLFEQMGAPAQSMAQRQHNFGARSGKKLEEISR